MQCANNFFEFRPQHTVLLQSCLSAFLRQMGLFNQKISSRDKQIREFIKLHWVPPSAVYSVCFLLNAGSWVTGKLINLFAAAIYTQRIINSFMDTGISTKQGCRFGVITMSWNVHVLFLIVLKYPHFWCGLFNSPLGRQPS